MLKRILVTGNAGSGKSTVSQQLSSLLKIPVYGLDKIVWGPRWQRIAKQQCQSKLIEILENEQWIIDGVCSQAAVMANVIIFLDMPRRACYWRVIKRNLPYLFKSRPGLPPQCPEILIIGYLVKLIWNFRKSVRPTLLNLLEQEKDNIDKTIIRIDNQRQWKHWLPILKAKHTTVANEHYKFIEKSAIL